MNENRASSSPLAGEDTETWPQGLVGVGEGGTSIRPSPGVASRRRPLPQGERRDGRLREFAKGMRSNPTDAERKLWTLLRAHRFDGHKFKRQVPIGPFIVDFVCLRARLIIEADGGQHSESARDVCRDKWFADNDFRVLRVWNNDVLTDLDGVADAILAALQAIPSPTSPSQHAGKASYPLPQGERKEMRA